MDILQEHYTDIQYELLVKTDALKNHRQKLKALEREVSDIQSEFQFERSDYLETIRRLEKNLKFYQQLLEKAVPFLRREGRFWNPDTIKADSTWNDDLKKWKISENVMLRVNLPPASKYYLYRIVKSLSISNYTNDDNKIIYVTICVCVCSSLWSFNNHHHYIITVFINLTVSDLYI